MKCFICNSTKKFTPLFPTYCQTPNYLCNTCGLVFLSKDKNSMQSYYKEDGYFKSSPNRALQKQFISKSLLIELAKERTDSMLEVMDLDLRKKRVLDIGCAYGEILYYLKKTYNCKVLGIEPSKETTEIGEKMFDVSIKPILLEEFKDKEKFDLILCNHTLEHVDNPSEFLLLMKNLLKPDGLIYIEVPNILKPTGRFNLNLFLYNEHLQNFTSNTLDLLLKKNKLYTYAYSDKNFLKFICGIDKKKSVDVKQTTAKQVLASLKEYKDNYSAVDYIYVYAQKLRYLARLIFYKTVDYIK